MSTKGERPERGEEEGGNDSRIPTLKKIAGDLDTLLYIQYITSLSLSLALSSFPHTPGAGTSLVSFFRSSRRAPLHTMLSPLVGLCLFAYSDHDHVYVHVHVNT